MSNIENRPDTQFFIPYKVTEDDFATMHITINDVVPYWVGGHCIMVYMAENYDPELYEIMKKDFQNQLKEEYREKKCVLSDGQGSFIKCTGSCWNCTKQHQNAKRSLEAEFDINHFEPESLYDDIAELEDRMTLEMLISKLRKLEPKCAEIMDLLLQGMPEGYIIDVLGWPRSTLYNLIDKGISLLKCLYEEKI